MNLHKDGHASPTGRRCHEGADEEAGSSDTTGVPAAWYVPNVKLVLDHAARHVEHRRVQPPDLLDEVVERLYRDVRGLRIYEGTSEIQKLIIANQLLKE